MADPFITKDPPAAHAPNGAGTDMGIAGAGTAGGVAGPGGANTAPSAVGNPPTAKNAPAPSQPGSVLTPQPKPVGTPGVDVPDVQHTSGPTGYEADPSVFVNNTPGKTAEPAPAADLGGYDNVTPTVSEFANSAIPTDKFINAPADYTVEQWDVTSEQTVAGQFASIMDSDNPAFQVVAEQVRRAAAANGQQNSAMANRGMAMAVAQVGFQIAAQDAATFARSAEFNATMANQFGLAQQEFMNQALLSDQNYSQGLMMLRESHKANVELADQQLRGQLAVVGAQASAQLQAQQLQAQNVFDQMDLAHSQQLSQMQAQLASQTQLQGQQGAIQHSLATQQQGFQLQQMGYGSDLRKDEMSLDAQIRSNLMAEEAGHTSQRDNQLHQNNMALSSLGQTHALQQMQVGQEYGQQNMATQQGYNLANMDRQTANQLYANTVAYNQSMQMQYAMGLQNSGNQLLQTIGMISSNPNITVAQQSAAINDAIAQQNAYNKYLASVYSQPMDPNSSVGNYLSFTGRPAQPGNPAQPGPVIPYYGGAPAAPFVPPSPPPVAPVNRGPVADPNVKPLNPAPAPTPAPAPAPIPAPAPVSPPPPGGGGKAGGGGGGAGGGGGMNPRYNQQIQ